MKKIFSTTVFLLLFFITIPSCTNSNNKAENANLATDETYTCSMHNEVMSDHEGKCPTCGMPLVKQKMTEAQNKMKRDGTYTKP